MSKFKMHNLNNNSKFQSHIPKGNYDRRFAGLFCRCDSECGCDSECSCQRVWIAKDYVERHKRKGARLHMNLDSGILPDYTCDEFCLTDCRDNCSCVSACNYVCSGDVGRVSDCR